MKTNYNSLFINSLVITIRIFKIQFLTQEVICGLSN